MPHTSTAPRLKTIGLVALLTVVLLSLSGCVYLRLLRFKNQLRDFDENIEVSPGADLSLLLRNPVLEDGDFVFLTDSQPTERIRISDSPQVEHWNWRFEKQRAKGSDSRHFNIMFGTRFEDSMLTQIDFDSKLLEVLPKEFVVTLFRSMGKASINKFRRSATAQMKRDQLEGVSLPTLRQIDEIMGAPTSVEEKEGDAYRWMYVFDFLNPENGELAGEFKLSFHADSDDLDQEIAGFTVTGKAR